jgi:hypothetical protein
LDVVSQQLANADNSPVCNLGKRVFLASLCGKRIKVAAAAAAAAVISVCGIEVSTQQEEA